LDQRPVSGSKGTARQPRTFPEPRRRSADRRTHRQNHRPNHFNPNSLIQAPRPNPHSTRGTATHPPPRFRALALFGRRPLQRPHTLVMPATENLVWGFFCQGVSGGRLICFPSSVSLFDLEARFLVPTRASLTSARAGAVKVRRRTNLAACATLARPHLDGFEHDGTLDAVGMTIRGKPAFGRDHSRRNLVFGGSRRPEP